MIGRSLWTYMQLYLSNHDAAGVHNNMTGLVVIDARGHVLKYGDQAFSKYLTTAIHEWLHEIYPFLSETEINACAERLRQRLDSHGESPEKTPNGED